MGTVSSDHIEIVEGWVVLEGLKWAWRKGIRELVVQCDACKVVELIREDKDVRGLMRDIIMDGRKWATKEWSVEFKHVLREQNEVADTLARIVIRNDNQWVELVTPCSKVETVLRDDIE